MTGSNLEAWNDYVSELVRRSEEDDALCADIVKTDAWKNYDLEVTHRVHRIHLHSSFEDMSADSVA